MAREDVAKEWDVQSKRGETPVRLQFRVQAAFLLEVFRGAVSIPRRRLRSFSTTRRMVPGATNARHPVNITAPNEPIPMKTPIPACISATKNRRTGLNVGFHIRNAKLISVPSVKATPRLERSRQ